MPHWQSTATSYSGDYAPASIPPRWPASADRGMRGSHGCCRISYASCRSARGLPPWCWHLRNSPAPPGYVRWKRIPFEIIEPDWAPFFGDADTAIDWRLVSWGGVLIDDRPLSQVSAPCPAVCIPALDNPAVTDEDGGDWYADERLIFGVVVNGEARAYPKHIMEIHEMVNDTLGERRIGIPYCTLRGSAQAYFTDRVPPRFQTLELRTSGLLARSNKVMFDLHTFSAFDTFRGLATSGPLQDAGYALEMLTIVTSGWGAWKAA